MKAFRWSLQRLLEITRQKELVLQGRLFQLSQEITSVHQQILHHRLIRRAVLAELAHQELEVRFRRQHVFMQFFQNAKARIERLREKLKALQDQRGEVMEKFTRTKSSREGLEKVRENALQRHRREMDALEQKQLDESSQIAFVRGMLRKQDEHLNVTGCEK